MSRRMPRPARLNPRVLLAEAGVLVALVTYYELGNLLFSADPQAAHTAARTLWRLEEQLGLFLEPWFQATFSAAPILMWLLIFFYVGPHFFLTLGFYAWAYWFRFPSFPEVRNSLVAFTLAAFGFQWFVPVSPPRFIAEAGLADTLEATLPVNGNTGWVQEFTNPYAALPSVHFGWALLVAYLAIRLGRSPHRWWWLAYPTTIGLSILATGNHWLLDLAYSAGVIALLELTLSLWPRAWTMTTSAPAKATFPPPGIGVPGAAARGLSDPASAPGGDPGPAPAADGSQ